MATNLDLVKTTPQVKQLYTELVNMGIDVKIELYNGYFTVDLAIPSKKINIEIDGGHHQFNSEQAFSDLNRTFYAYSHGYFTLRIPNICIEKDLKKTAELVKRFIEDRN